MASKGQKFLKCPDCGKKGVSLRFAPSDEDGYGCGYCDFWFFLVGDYPADVENRMRLAILNPGYDD